MIRFSVFIILCILLTGCCEKKSSAPELSAAENSDSATPMNNNPPDSSDFESKIKQDLIGNFENTFCQAGTGEIYIIDSFTKRKIPDSFTFQALDGYRGKILHVSPELLEIIPTGNPIPSIINPEITADFLSLYKDKYITIANKNIYYFLSDLPTKYTDRKLFFMFHPIPHAAILKVSSDIADLFPPCETVSNSFNLPLSEFKSMFNNLTLMYKTAEDTQMFRIEDGKSRMIPDWSTAVSYGTRPLELSSEIIRMFDTAETVVSAVDNSRASVLRELYENQLIRVPEGEEVFKVVAGKRQFYKKYRALDKTEQKAVLELPRDLFYSFGEN